MAVAFVVDKTTHHDNLNMKRQRNGKPDVLHAWYEANRPVQKSWQHCIIENCLRVFQLTRWYEDAGSSVR